MAFATVEDVATRLARDLTEEETAQAELLLELAQGAIAAAADKTDAWAAALSPVPNILRLYAIELVSRVMGNPKSLTRFQETLGQFSTSESYRDTAAGGGMQLTELEERVIRRAVYGRTSGSAKTESLATEIADLVIGCGS